ncbi:5-oxoprolinase subunit PxpA [Colwellia sp. RSH04]|uniref:5-oxoprolinase subunit PxpA n=1 Tax=Colwellia sp. RSH04 TaxID=2305464 RepID=UPI000E597E08|nr:5-oxoprolinase subunit PxpA [Colwellia sp. RSH04]RHW74919.1 5-oxoprolinase subunit PxpA [Colwellia sp. RSH04]
MKLNCDLGESFGSWKMGLDSKVMPYIDQASIACGFHAGDPLTLVNTLNLAAKHNVDIGAHPSYPDIVGFGRRSMQCSQEELSAMMLYQIAAVDGVAKSQSLSLTYVKPHGALYNDMMKNEPIRQTILQSISQYNQSGDRALKLMIQATPKFSQHQDEAKRYKVELLAEAFADRCYADDGSLLSRQHEKAIHTQEKMLQQVKQLKEQGTITTVQGKTIALTVDSLCVHGDNMAAVKLIANIKEILS